MIYGISRINLFPSPGLTVLRDNATRWNSTYTMIERALCLKDRIAIFCNGNKQDLSLDTLSEAEWTELADMKEILEEFKEYTKAAEGGTAGGRHGSLWCVLIAIEGLMAHVEKMKTSKKSKGGRPYWSRPRLE